MVPEALKKLSFPIEKIVNCSPFLDETGGKRFTDLRMARLSALCISPERFIEASRDPEIIWD